MIKIQTALLAVALTTPFGLAIHDDLTRETPDPDQLAALTWTLNDTVAAPIDDLDGTLHLDEAALDDSHDNDSYDDLETADEAVPDDVEDDVPVLSQDTVRQLAGTERASLGPALAPLRFGMTADQARAAVPRLNDWSGPDDPLAQIDVLPEFLGNGDTQLTAVQIETRADVDAIAAELRSLWGEPQMQAPEAADATRWPMIWIDEATGRRAALTIDDVYTSLTFSQVMTLDQLLGKPGDKGMFGFARHKRVLGATLADLRGVLDGLWLDPYYGEYATLQLPGVTVDPTASTTTRVVLSLEKGKVRTVNFEIACGARCPEVIAALRARHGEPTTTAAGAMTYRTGSSSELMVQATPDNAALVFTATQLNR